jgi:hypothetical protein
MRWGRGFMLFAAVVALLWTPVTALAGCATDPTSCMPSPPPPTATPRATPKPSAKPTAKPAAPTAAPSTHYVPPPVSQTTSNDQPSSTLAPVEVTSPAPTAEVTVPGPAFNTLPSAPIDTVHNSASLTTWFFGFIAGGLVGFLIGRASWGISRRRRRQQIFG